MEYHVFQVFPIKMQSIHKILKQNLIKKKLKMNMKKNEIPILEKNQEIKLPVKIIVSGLKQTQKKYCVSSKITGIFHYLLSVQSITFTLQVKQLLKPWKKKKGKIYIST